MKKNLRLMLAAVLMMFGMTAMAEVVTDELTWEGLELVGTNSNYNEFSDKTFTSSANYAGIASSGSGKYIQLRTKNKNEGIITTTSGGKLKAVVITFNESTTDRKISIYAKNSAYSAASDLYDADKQGDKLGDIAADATNFRLDVTGDYTFVGLRSADGAIYINKIEIEWESSGGPVETKAAKPTISPNGGSFYDSQEVTISAAEGAKIYYALNSGNFQLYSAPFTLTETTTVKAYAIDETCDVKQSETVEATFTKEVIEEISVAEALEIVNGLEDGATTSKFYDVKGFVVGTPDFQRNADNVLYGNVNFNMADEKGGTTTITAFRTKNIGNVAFTEETINSPKENDAVVVRGKLQKYKDKNNNITPEITSSYLISVTSGETNIITTMRTASQQGEIFNLQGQRVAQPTKGLYIIDGRKVMVK